MLLIAAEKCIPQGQGKPVGKVVGLWVTQLKRENQISLVELNSKESTRRRKIK